MAVHGELRPDDRALPLLVASAALSKADSAMTRPTGSVRIDNGDGTETWLGEAASESGGVVQWVNDTTPPARPIGVTATCQAGVVVAAWAGELEEPIPADFSHVEVFAQKDGSSDVVDAGMLYGAGSVTLTGFAEGDIVDVWAVAYDDAHDESGVSKPNASGKSDIATVVVEPVVSQQQLAAKADEILNAGKAYSDQLNSQIQTDMSTAKKSIDANTDAVKAAQKTADDTKTSIEQTASKVESIDSSLASVKSTLDSTAATVTEQGSVINQANRNIAVLQSRQTSVESVANGAKADAANAVKTAGSATDTADTAAGIASAAARTAAEAKNGTVVKTVYEYAVSSSPTRKPDTYYTYPPEWKAGQYIWVRTRVTYGDGSESVTDPVVVTGNTGLTGPQGVQGVPGKDGADGKQGAAGVSVTGVTPYWATGLTAPEKPTVKTPGSPWQSTEPAYRYDAQTDLYKCSRADFSDGSFQWTSVVTDSAYVAARDAEKAARDAKDTATASKTLAESAKIAAADSASAKKIAQDAQATATDASTTAVNANTTATAARTAASSANTQAAQAVGIANSKGDVLIQDTTPATSMQKATTLWIDTTGGANTPKKWNGSTWAAVTDKTATDAASQAVKATGLANTAQATADSARVTAANAQAISVKAQATADGAQTTADSKNTVYTQQDEPSHAKLVPGDLWYQRNNYRTYWQGEPNNSVSVMEIPSSRIKGVKIWDGSEFVDYVFVADKVIAENSVTTGLLAADAIYGKVLKGGEFLTSNGRLTINDAGLVARDKSGNATLTVDASTGAVTMKGGLTSGSSVNGATVKGGTVDADEYQLHAGSVLVGKANSSGVYFGDSLSYAQSGSVWKLTLKNASIQAPTINAATFTGGTIQTTSDANKGVKLTSGGLVAYGSDGKPSFTLKASDGSLNLNGAVMTNSTVSAATVNGGVITGANLNGVTITGGTIQTVGTVNRGVKITSAGLKAWDGNGNQTLDLNGSTNTMTGTFRTADSGARIEISNTTSGGVAIGEMSGHDKYGNVNWLVQGDITGDGIYGNGDNPPDPLDTTTMHLGVTEQNPEINITGWGNGYRQISMGADRVDFTSSSVSDRTHVPDAGIYINGLRIDPYYVTDISKILTFQDSNWSEYKGAGGNDPRTRLLIVGNLRFLTLELQRSGNINARWRAGTILPEHIPANGINAAAAMAGGGVGDAYIIGRNVDSGATDAHGNPVKAGEIYIDPVSDYVGKSYWFCATFIYQV